MISRLPCLVVAVVLMHASPVFAHGRIPDAYSVVTRESGELLGVVTTLGLVTEIDDDWRWMCRASLSISPTEDPLFVAQPGGGFVASTFRGLLEIGPGLCTTGVADGFGGVIIDVQDDPGGNTVVALQSDGAGQDNSLLRYDLESETWQPTGDAIEPILFERVRISPSNPERIYLSGAYPRTATEPERRMFTHRSDDGGQTWTVTPFEYRDGERNILLLAVDPDNEDIVYARIVRERDRPEVPERLILSEDGGQTWTTLLEVEGTVGDLAFIDGTAVLSLPFFALDPPPPYGLWHAPDRRTFEPLTPDLDARCVHSRAGILYVCASEARDGFTVARSADGGATLEPVFSLSELAGPAECGADRAEVCAQDDDDVVCDLRLDGFEELMCVGFPSDAGSPDMGGLGDAGDADAGIPPAPPSSCVCAAAGSAPTHASLGWLALGLAGVSLRRRLRLRR